MRRVLTLFMAALVIAVVGIDFAGGAPGPNAKLSVLRLPVPVLSLP